jgi:N-acetylglucosaminyldiphosphoundecaprenol N-acetyl-beta-D-mannosaminyltransferase
MTRVKVTQLGVDDISLTELKTYLFERSTLPQVSIVNYANAHGCNVACRDKKFREVMGKADLVFCDGNGVMLGAKILGHALKERMTPPDWIDDFFIRCIRENKKVFFVGEPQETLDAFRAVLNQKHPDLKIAGFHHGYFTFDSDEEKALIHTLQETQPDFILTGMGMPKQEIWAERMRGCLSSGVILSTGALFKWYAGIEVRKRSFLTDHGFEWLCRLVQHPVQLFGRYVIGNSIFLMRIFIQKLSKGINH